MVLVVVAAAWEILSFPVFISDNVLFKDPFSDIHSLGAIHLEYRGFKNQAYVCK